MPVLSENVIYEDHAGSKIADAVVKRFFTNTVTGGDVAHAFMEAVTAFKEEFGRMPNWDRVSFNGGTTTSKVILEIVEEPEE